MRQDLALLLLVHGGKYDPTRGGIYRWLTWHWANLHRNRKGLRVFEDEILDVLCVENADPANVAATRDEIATMSRALEKLPSLEQNVLRLSYGLDGQEPKPFHEIAQRMGITSQWAYQRRVAGIEKLRGMMEQR